MSYPVLTCPTLPYPKVKCVTEVTQRLDVDVGLDPTLPYPFQFFIVDENDVNTLHRLL